MKIEIKKSENMIPVRSKEASRILNIIVRK